MKINIINKSSHDLPRYETIASAGMDLRAHIEQDIILKPLERSIIPTGLFMALPVGLRSPGASTKWFGRQIRLDGPEQPRDYRRRL